MLKPLAFPPLKASAQALNWMLQLLETAAAWLTKVLPLTSNGREESPELVMAGAVIPPSAELLDVTVAVLLTKVAETILVAAAEGLLD